MARASGFGAEAARRIWNGIRPDAPVYWLVRTLGAKRAAALISRGLQEVGVPFLFAQAGAAALVSLYRDEAPKTKRRPTRRVASGARRQISGSSRRW